MKRIIAICIAAIICAAIFAVPLYYKTFFKAEVAPAPQATTTAEVKNKYIVDGIGDSAYVLNQETGEVYYIYGKKIWKCAGDIIQ